MNSFRRLCPIHSSATSEYISQLLFLQFSSPLTVSVHLNTCKIWVGFTLETCQNQPQPVISLNFEYKAGPIISCEPLPNKKCFFLILCEICYGYGSCYRELLMLAHIPPHSCGFVSCLSQTSNMWMFIFKCAVQMSKTFCRWTNLKTSLMLQRMKMIRLVYVLMLCF